jgi:hypothetical protein
VEETGPVSLHLSYPRWGLGLALGWKAVLASLIAVGIAGCGDDGGDAAHVPSTGAAGAPIVDCKSRSQVIPSRHPGSRPGSVRNVSAFAGPVMFIGAKQWENDSFKPRPGGLQPVKVPIQVEAAHTVTVSVSPPAGRRAIVEVGRDHGPAVGGRTVELRACPPSATVANRRVGPRTPFLAGFRLDGPMCLDVHVDVAGRARPIARRIKFGKRTCAEARQAPVLKTGKSPAAEVEVASLRPCPPVTQGTRRPVGGDWSARVAGVRCGTVGRFIFDRFLDSGLQAEFVANRDQSVELGRVNCGMHPQPDGWIVRCVRGDQQFAFLLRP